MLFICSKKRVHLKLSLWRLLWFLKPQIPLDVGYAILDPEQYRKLSKLNSLITHLDIALFFIVVSKLILVDSEYCLLKIY